MARQRVRVRQNLCCKILSPNVSVYWLGNQDDRLNIVRVPENKIGPEKFSKMHALRLILVFTEVQICYAKDRLWKSAVREISLAVYACWGMSSDQLGPQTN